MPSGFLLNILTLRKLKKYRGKETLAPLSDSPWIDDTQLMLIFSRSY
jgi:hypothetical protein